MASAPLGSWGAYVEIMPSPSPGFIPPLAFHSAGSRQFGVGRGEGECHKSQPIIDASPTLSGIRNVGDILFSVKSLILSYKIAWRSNLQMPPDATYPQSRATIVNRKIEV
ncbi:hypothetical protein TNIN_198311 [Trichonephila inaurata madagascariensis]|uniref:Uncharacterized protein n=1 Tax=Trichonephila inaurata madagascariensis TaxID=2747483 RepID=A0A8X6WWV8_9ARAC|nr:hypothetical protein TNIN_198311 [Trichonephila inaurata madagascariensis]